MDKDGNNLIVSATKMFEYLKKNFGEPDIKAESKDATKNWNEINKLTFLSQGILIFIPNDPKSFGATGHATIYSQPLKTTILYNYQHVA